MAGTVVIAGVLVASILSVVGAIDTNGTLAATDGPRSGPGKGLLADALASPDPGSPSPDPGSPSPSPSPDLGSPSPSASQAASPSPTATPGPAIVPPNRARTVDAPVPRSLLANLARVSTEMPLPYRDGCHGAAASSTRCFYGNLRSRTTIVLFGDSHALSWFPAVLQLARDRGWRVLNLTRSACGPASILSYSKVTHSVMRSCLTWRAQAISRLVQLRPAIILVSGTRGFAVVDASGRILTGKAKTDAWIRGMKRTLAPLVPAAGRVILLADTPSSLVANPAGCLARNPGHALKCATSVAHAISYPWLNTEFGVAKAMKTGFINPELWVCPTSPCPEVVWGRLVHRNPGHLTVSFTTAQWRRLEQAILRDLARRTTSTRP